MQTKRKVQIFIAIICFILAFSITLQYKSVTRNKSAVHQETARVQDLENKLINANQQIIDLKKENMQLHSDIDVYRKDAASKDSGAGALKVELEKSLLVAGLTAVEGPGIEITLADSTLEKTSMDAESGIVHDSDILSVVNELFGAGAEAVSVNSERLVSNSSIRCVGNTIMVNGKRCASPFVIKAIGDADALESSMNMRGGILEVLKLYKINVNVTKSTSIKLDKYSGSTTYSYAKKTEKQVKQ